MAQVPAQLTLARHRDLEGHGHRPYARWALLTLLGVFILLGLLNAFGQNPHTDTASADGVELEVYSPRRVRSGLLFMSRFTIRAERDVKAATLVLGPGWLEGITVNTIEPSPVGEASRDGKLALDLGHMPAGTSTCSTSSSRSTRPTSAAARRTSRSTTATTRLLTSTAR